MFILDPKKLEKAWAEIEAEGLTAEEAAKRLQKSLSLASKAPKRTFPDLSEIGISDSSDELPVEWSEEEPELHEVFETPEQRELDLKRIEEEMKNGTLPPLPF